MTIEIKDSDTADAGKFKVKGPLTIDGKTFDAWFEKAEDIPIFQARLDAELADDAKARQAAIADRNRQIAAKDAEIAAINREIEAVRATVKTQVDEIDRRAHKRVALLQTARALDANLKCSKLSDAEIRRAIVRTRCGDEAITGRGDEYVEARFDLLADQIKPGDPSAHMVKDGINSSGSDRITSDRAYEEMVLHMTTAHKSVH